MGYLHRIEVRQRTLPLGKRNKRERGYCRDYPQLCRRPGDEWKGKEYDQSLPRWKIKAVTVSLINVWVDKFLLLYYVSGAFHVELPK